MDNPLAPSRAHPLQSERTQGFAADPVYVKGEVFAYVGLPQNLKDLKGWVLAGEGGGSGDALQGHLAHKKQQPPRRPP